MSRRYHSVTLGMKKPWNNTPFLVCPQQENHCVYAPPAEGAEEDTESPWDSEVLSVKDMEVSTRDVGRTVPFRVGGRSWVKLRTWVSQQLAFDIEEECDETQRQLSQEKSARALQEGESDTEREKAVLLKNQLLQDEIAVLRRELDQVRLKHQEEEGKLLEENEALKGKNEDLKKELKRNEEALTQTALQYDGQLNFLRTESAVLTSKLEQTQEGKGRLETEIESFRSRLSSAAQELERLQSSKSDVERTLQRERDEWLRLQDKLQRDLSDVRETNRSLSQQLSEAENKANSLQNELHQLEQVLREKTLLLETTQKELSQAQCQAKERDRARHLEKDQVSQFLIKQESTQERLAQLQSENLLLRQQLEDTQNKGVIKEKVANDVQDWFHDIFSKLRADTEKRVYLVEERNKELNANCADLRERVLKYEMDRVEREGMVRQLQQELADALKKQSMSEASLEVTARYRRDLEEDKLRLQKEAEEVKTETQAASQDQLEEIRASHHTLLRHQLPHRIGDLECELDSVKNTQEDGVSQKESTPAEAERFKELYVEEVKMRRCLANKLERKDRFQDLYCWNKDRSFRGQCRVTSN
ncbi:ankyrin repeat domain-containing protein 26-like [Rhynochetos jubatus]